MRFKTVKKVAMAGLLLSLLLLYARQKSKWNA